MGTFTDNDKLAVIEFVKRHFEKQGAIPTIRTITREINVNPKDLYKLFPGGLQAICIAAGCPPPQKRIEQTQAAKESRLKHTQDKSKKECNSSIIEKYNLFNKKNFLNQQIDRLLVKLNAPFEKSLASEVTLLKLRISYVKGKIDAMDKEDLDQLAEILVNEKKEIDDLLQKNEAMTQEKKRNWLRQTLMPQGHSEEEANDYLKKTLALTYGNLDVLYDIERQSEQRRKVAEECLRHMSEREYSWITFTLNRDADAEEIVHFSQMQQSVIEKYVEEIRKEMHAFYRTHSHLFTKESLHSLDMKGEFENYLRRKGLTPCPYCYTLIDYLHAPRSFHCPGCRGMLHRRFA